MDSNISGDFKVIYTASSSLNQYTVPNLKEGTMYRFKIQAKNFNGWGEPSDIGSFYTCVRPSGLDRPVIVSTTSDSVTLEWTPPADDGACPVTGYALFRDDGVSGVPSIEINVDNDPDIRNKPTLRRAVAAFDPANLGTKYAFQVRVYNREGETGGTVASYLFSTTPSKPIDSPRVIV